jgi:hypothetical protein
MNEPDSDPYLTPIPERPLAGIAPDLLAVLRRRQDRALERRDAERAIRELKRARPDLYWSCSRST